MAKDKSHNQRPEEGAEGNNAVGTDQPDSTRRKLTKAGLVAPVIMTLASTPVWGANCTMSGQMSGNLSNPADDCGGQGCTPGFWCNSEGSWHPDFPTDALFNDVFMTNAFPGCTLFEVVCQVDDSLPDCEMNVPGGCSPQNTCENLLRQLGFHAVAALQNSTSSVSYDLTINEVISGFVNAYNEGSKAAFESSKNAFASFNEQGCPLANDNSF